MGNTRSLIIQGFKPNILCTFIQRFLDLAKGLVQITGTIQVDGSVCVTLNVKQFLRRTLDIYTFYGHFPHFLQKTLFFESTELDWKKTFWSGLESYSRIFWIQCLYFLPNLDLKICFPNFTTHAKSILELVKLKTSQIWNGMLKTQC